MELNITPEAIMELEKSFNSPATSVKKVNSFDTKNYLNVRLEKGETKKKLTIRLLPMDINSKSPFVKVHTHNVPVPEAVYKSGHKTYICLSKNADIDHEKFGTKCPLCEKNREKYEESQAEGLDPAKKDELIRESLNYRSKESVIVRCIERGKEDEGVKFWKFNLRSDKSDPYNQMINLYHERMESGKKKGKDVNIFDLYNGKDLIVSITEGNSAPIITDDDEYTPLSEDKAQIEAWCNDPKKWQDVFTAKPYEYLKIISEKKVPWYDKVRGVWVEKEEFERDNKTAAENAEKQTDEAEKMYEAVANTTNVEPANTWNNQEPENLDLPF